MADITQTVTVEPVIITDESGVSLTVYTAQEGDKRGDNEGAMLAELIYNTALGSMEVSQQNETVQVVTEQLEEVEQGEASEVASSVIGTEFWCSSHVSNKSTDDLATKVLLQIIKMPNIQEKLGDKKMRRKLVWTEIADKMKEAGFHIQDRAPDRCYQKFRTLERKYKEFVQGTIVPGKGRKTMPEFYDDLRAICGDKHTSHHVSVVDTLHDYSEAAPNNEELYGEITLENASHTVGSATVRRFARPAHNSAKRMRLDDPVSLIREIRDEQARRDAELRAKERRLRQERVLHEQRRFNEMKRLMERQHSERMAATYALIKAVKEIKKRSA